MLYPLRDLGTGGESKVVETKRHQPYPLAQTPEVQKNGLIASIYYLPLFGRIPST